MRKKTPHLTYILTHFAIASFSWTIFYYLNERKKSKQSFFLDVGFVSFLILFLFKNIDRMPKYSKIFSCQKILFSKYLKHCKVFDLRFCYNTLKFYFFILFYLIKLFVHDRPDISYKTRPEHDVYIVRKCLPKESASTDNLAKYTKEGAYR